MPPPSSPLTNSAIAETLGLPPQASSSAMIALYSAALGPVQLPRYLALFERFDRASRDGRIDRAPLGWNLAASLLTLDWMVLHSLWKAALVYAVLVYGLALAVWGVAQPLLNLPASVEYGLLGALGLFSIALPGLFGDALLHGQTRQRIGRAIAAEPNLPGACALLEKQASSQPKLIKIAVAHALLLVLLALALFISPPAAGALPSPKPMPVRAAKPAKPCPPSPPRAPPPPQPRCPDCCAQRRRRSRWNHWSRPPRLHRLPKPPRRRRPPYLKRPPPHCRRPCQPRCQRQPLRQHQHPCPLRHWLPRPRHPPLQRHRLHPPRRRKKPPPEQSKP